MYAIKSIINTIGWKKQNNEVVVEWIVKEIEQEDTEEAVDLFLQEFVWFNLINIVMTISHQCYDTSALWYDCLMP